MLDPVIGDGCVIALAFVVPEVEAEISVAVAGRLDDGVNVEAEEAVFKLALSRWAMGDRRRDAS